MYRGDNERECVYANVKLKSSHSWWMVDDNNLKNGRKPVKLQKESPAGCAGEGKQSEGN